MSELERQLARMQAQLQQAEERAKQEREWANQERERADRAEKQASQERERADRAEKRVDRERERAEQAEEKVQRTTFLKYLHNLQTIVAPTLVVENRTTEQSSGAVTEVYGKVYPRVLRRWDEFPRLCDEQFDAFVNVFGEQQLFRSWSSIKAAESDLSSDPRRDEQDIRPFIRTYAERPAMRIANKFAETDPALQGTKFRFRNNAYGLHPKLSQDDGASPSPSKKRSPDRITSLVPDRWGIRVVQEPGQEPGEEFDIRTTALVGEYKAAHKARRWTFHQVIGSDPLPETFFADCARGAEGEPEPEATAEAEPREDPGAVPGRPDRRSRMIVAKVLCQAYHYMIISGLAYGYIASGDCMIFLAIPRGTPEVLLVHLLDESPSAATPRQSHAVQLATLALLALKAEIPPAQWILHAERTLPRWPPRKKEGDDRSGTNTPITGDATPSLPPPPDPSASSRRNTGGEGRDNDDDQRGDGQDTPRAATAKRKREEETRLTAPSSHNGDGGKASDGLSPYNGGGMTDARTYCTQACLLGLCRGGPLDPNCPNTPAHVQPGCGGPPHHHAVSASEVCLRIRDRLARDLDHGCECLDKYGLFGATGVLFKMTDPTYGYVFVAKGVQEVDEGFLADEARVYARCLDLQGTRIPVYLGTVDLVHPYPLRSLATVTRMMLLSWAGTTLAARAPPAGVNVRAEAAAAVEELRRRGVEHDDIRDANLTWDDRAKAVMVIDFHLAYLYAAPKRARTRVDEAGARCTREQAEAAAL